MTDRRPLNEQELERWRLDNRYRLSYRPDLEPPQVHVPTAACASRCRTTK